MRDSDHHKFSLRHSIDDLNGKSAHEDSPMIAPKRRSAFRKPPDLGEGGPQSFPEMRPDALTLPPVSGPKCCRFAFGLRIETEAH